MPAKNVTDLKIGNRIIITPRGPGTSRIFGTVNGPAVYVDGYYLSLDIDGTCTSIVIDTSEWHIQEQH